MRSEFKFTTIIPEQVINIENQDLYLKNITSKQFYNQLIQYKMKIPIGLLYWVEEYDLTEFDIKTGFIFA